MLEAKNPGGPPAGEGPAGRYNMAIYEQIEIAADLIGSALDTLGTLAGDLEALTRGRDPGPVCPECAECALSESCAAAIPLKPGQRPQQCPYKIERVIQNVGESVPLYQITRWRD